MKNLIFNIVEKVILMFFITLILVTNNFTISLAEESLDSIIDGAQQFVNQGEKKEKEEAKITQDQMQKASKLIAGSLLTIGVIVATIVIFILGIKYMTAPIAEKAETKQAMMPFIVGCFVMFGAYIIWSVVVKLLQTVK